MEASLAVAADLEAERAALEHIGVSGWNGRNIKVDQARRRYASTEPENRLVARTLERDWEAALAEQVRLTADYERFRRERPKSPTSGAELAAIRELTTDLPALWQAATTTSEERQTIVRFLLERVSADRGRRAVNKSAWNATGMAASRTDQHADTPGGAQ